MRESIIAASVEVGSMLDGPAPAALTTFQTDITSDLRDNWSIDEWIRFLFVDSISWLGMKAIQNECFVNEGNLSI